MRRASSAAVRPSADKEAEPDSEGRDSVAGGAKKARGEWCDALKDGGEDGRDPETVGRTPFGARNRRPRGRNRKSGAAGGDDVLAMMRTLQATIRKADEAREEAARSIGETQELIRQRTRELGAPCQPGGQSFTRHSALQANYMRKCWAYATPPSPHMFTSLAAMATAMVCGARDIYVDPTSSTKRAWRAMTRARIKVTPTSERIVLIEAVYRMGRICSEWPDIYGEAGEHLRTLAETLVAVCASVKWGKRFDTLNMLDYLHQVLRRYFSTSVRATAQGEQYLAAFQTDLLRRFSLYEDPADVPRLCRGCGGVVCGPKSCLIYPDLKLRGAA